MSHLTDAELNEFLENAKIVKDLDSTQDEYDDSLEALKALFEKNLSAHEKDNNLSEGVLNYGELKFTKRVQDANLKNTKNAKDLIDEMTLEVSPLPIPKSTRSKRSSVSPDPRSKTTTTTTTRPRGGSVSEEEKPKATRPKADSAPNVSSLEEQRNTARTVEANYRIMALLISFDTTKNIESLKNGIVNLGNASPQHKAVSNLALKLLGMQGDVSTKVTTTILVRIAATIDTMLNTLKLNTEAVVYGVKDLHFIRLEKPIFFDRSAETYVSKKPKKVKNVPMLFVTAGTAPSKTDVDMKLIHPELLENAKNIFLIPLRWNKFAQDKHFSQFILKLKDLIDFYKVKLQDYPASKDYGMQYPEDFHQGFISPKTAAFGLKEKRITIRASTVKQLEEVYKRVVKNAFLHRKSSKNTKTKVTERIIDGDKRKAGPRKKPVLLLKETTNWIKSSDHLASVRTAVRDVANTERRAPVLKALAAHLGTNVGSSALEMGVSLFEVIPWLFTIELVDAESFKFKAESDAFVNKQTPEMKKLLDSKISYGYNREGDRVLLSKPKSILTIISEKSKNKLEDEKSGVHLKSQSAANKPDFNPDSFSGTDLGKVYNVLVVPEKYEDGNATVDSYGEFKFVSKRSEKSGNKSLSTDEVVFGNVTAGEVRAYLEEEASAVKALYNKASAEKLALQNERKADLKRQKAITARR